MSLTRTTAWMQTMTDIAEKLGKPLDDLEPFKDYDPIMVDNEVRRQTRPRGNHWAGD